MQRLPLLSGALAAILLAPGLAAAQGSSRGVDVAPRAAPRPPQPTVRIVEWVNQSFTVPDTIGVFETPDASRDPVARLRVGEAVEVLGVLEGQTWLQIRLPNTTVGYVVATAIPGALRPRPASMAPAVVTQPSPPPMVPGMPATPPVAAPQPITGPALVHDTATLVVGGQRVALAHLVGLGGNAANGLQAFIRESGGSVSCRPAEIAHVCTLPDNTDVALAALVNGAAGLLPGAPALYRAQAEEARRNRRGIWGRAAAQGSVEDQAATLLPIAVVASTPPAAFQQGRVADGLAYLSGQPYAWQEDGAAPLVFVPVIGWGYWDRRQMWRPAAAAWVPILERRNPAGRGLRDVDIARLGIPLIPRAPRTPASGR